MTRHYPHLMILVFCGVFSLAGCGGPEVRAPVQVWEIANGRTYKEGTVQVQGVNTETTKDGFLNYAFVVKNLTINTIRLVFRIRFFDPDGLQFITHHSRPWQAISLESEVAVRIEGRSPMRFAKSVAMEIKED